MFEEDIIDRIYASSHSKIFLPTRLKGVFVGSLIEGQDSAYKEYFKLHKKETPESFGEPIKKEVIDFIVDSLVVEEGKIFGDIKEKLRQGFHQINRNSITGRALLKHVRFKQILNATEDLQGPLGCVYRMFDIIFIDKALHHRQNPLDLATTFLHESEHVIDGFQVRPCFMQEQGYFNKYNVEVRDGDGPYSAQHDFMLYRLFEAEKRAQTYQLLSENMSFFQYVKGVYSCLGKSYFDFCTSFVQSIFSLFKKKEAGLLLPPKPPKDTQVLLGYKTKVVGREILAYLKNPLALFKKQARIQIKKEVALQSMAKHIQYLMMPNQQKMSFYWVANILSLGFLGLGCMVANPFCLLAGLMGCATVYGIYFADKYYRLGRDGWCDSYNKNAYNSSRTRPVYETESCKKYRLILKVFQDKYQGYLKAKELEKSQTDRGEFESIFKTKKEIENLPASLKADVLFISKLFYDHATGKNKAILPEWWSHELMVKAKQVQRQNKGFSLERSVQELVLLRLKESDIFDLMIQQAKLEDFLKIKTPCLKEAFLQKRALFFKEEKGLYRQKPVKILSAKKRLQQRRKQKEYSR